MFSDPTFTDTGVDYIALLGQSNAVGQGLYNDPEPPTDQVIMFGNDYQWRRACEPVDDITNQVDLISKDGGSVVPGNGQNCHSMWLRAAKEVVRGTNRKICLIPCMKGSTVFSSPRDTDLNPLATSWRRPSDWEHTTRRDTLWGSAYHRIKVATGGRPLKAIWHFGHESNCESNYAGYDDLLATYQEDAIRFFKQFRESLGYHVPIIYGNLAAFDNVSDVTPTSATQYDNTNLWLNMHVARDHLRQIEGTLQDFYMVCSLDAGLTDYVHMNRAGVDLVGTRFGKATRKYVYGDALGDDDGIGPRPVRFEIVDGTTSRIYFDKAVQDSGGTLYSGLIRVFTNTGHKAVSLAIREGPTGEDAKHVVMINASTTGYTYADVTYGQTRRSAAVTDCIKDDYGHSAPGFIMRAT